MSVEAERKLIVLFMKELNKISIKRHKFSRNVKPVILLDTIFEEMVIDSNLQPL